MAPAELDNEIFVRLSIVDPEDDSVVTAWTMTVSDALAMFYGLATDLKEIVNEDLAWNELPPQSLFEPRMN